MSGDHARFSFDPHHGFSGVWQQQGRVTLDADFNEFEEILDRLRRATTYDTVGAGIVPAATPHGFELGFTENGELTIGVGRAYVDGILVECFGTPLTFDDANGHEISTGTAIFDGAIGHEVSTRALPVSEQPFHYDDGWTAPSEDPRRLVYLDVWQREVSVYEHDDLREPALGGPDTTTRVQTAWQVKTLGPPAREAASSSPDCDADWPGWDELVAPSTGRLTVKVNPAPAALRACEVPTEAGYVGLENRLYRIEIHEGGGLGQDEPGQATFKWSRDNASLVAAVTKINKVGTGSKITVKSTGRDAFARFETGDHIELLDDWVEFGMRDKNLGGDLAKITAVDHEAAAIVVDADLSGFAVQQERHPRIRRWDSATKADPALRKAVAGEPIQLEDGIAITFKPAEGRVRAGDYWVVAARTATGKLSRELENAPPRGSLHHFMKLGVVTRADGETPEVIHDCRVMWPKPTAGCGCDFCVTVESHKSRDLSIQHAIELAKEVGGGTITLCPGEYEVNEPIRLQEAHSIVLRGPGATLSAKGTAIEVNGTLDVTITGMRIACTADRAEDADPAVVLQDCGGTKLEGVAIDVHNSNRGPTGSGIKLVGGQWLTTLRRNFIIADVGIEGIADSSFGPLSNGLRIEDNTFVCVPRGGESSQCGVSLTGTSQHIGEVRIADNVVTGTTDAGIAATGRLLRDPVPVGGRGPHENVVDGVLTITGNVIETVVGVGIRTAGRAVLDDNEITRFIPPGTPEPLPEPPPEQHGIHVVDTQRQGDDLGHVLIVGNRAVGIGGFGVLVDAPVASLLVKQNVIHGTGGGIMVREESNKQHISVDNNHILDVRGRGTRPEFDEEMGDEDNIVFGIAISGGRREQELPGLGTVHVAGNMINGVTPTTDRSPLAAFALWVDHAREVRIVGNTILNAVSIKQNAIGICVASAIESVSITDNTVRADPNSELRPNIALGVLGEPGTLTHALNVLHGGRADPTAARVQVEGNQLLGNGPRPAVIILTTGAALVTTNRISQREPSRGVPALELQALHAVLHGNYARRGDVRGESDQERRVIGLTITESVAIVGNMTGPGDIQIRNAAGATYATIGAPWRPLNPIV